MNSNNAGELFEREAPVRIDWRSPPRGQDPAIDAMRDGLYDLILEHFGEVVLCKFELRYGNINGLRIGCLRYWSDRVRDKVTGEDSAEDAYKDSGEIEL